jgi:hypothetical protein
MAYMTDRRDLYPTTGCARVLPCPAPSHARYGRRWVDPQGTIHSIPAMSTQTPSLLCSFPSLPFISFSSIASLPFLFFPCLLFLFFPLFLFFFFFFPSHQSETSQGMTTPSKIKSITIKVVN